MTLREFVLQQSQLPTGNTVREHIKNPKVNIDANFSTVLQGIVTNDSLDGTVKNNKLLGTISEDALDGIYKKTESLTGTIDCDELQGEL